jgi:hypothetical protein
MLLDRLRPHAFREQRVSPEESAAASKAVIAKVNERAQRNPALEGANTLSDINVSAARMSFGMIKPDYPDYHSYDLIALKRERS